MSAQAELLLPLSFWEEGMELKAQRGNKIKRWGSVAQACVMLDYAKDSIYGLIEAEEIVGRKRKAGRNAHWRVDLVSVWEYKMRVDAGEFSGL